MIQWLSRSQRRARAQVVDSLYEEVAAAARRPMLYARWQVPDTPLGRFEMLTLHLFLLLRRMKGAGDAMRDVSQEIVDRFFREIDHSLRELGIGDMGVPKRMKRLARMFYGRLAVYDEAIEAAPGPQLAAALERNVRPGVSWPEAEALADYCRRARAELERIDDEALLTGRLAFAALPAGDVEEIRHEG